MSFRGLLDSKCTIKQETLGAADGMGGYGVSTWSTLYKRVPCRYETLPGEQEVFAYGKKVTYPREFIYLEYRTGIKEGQRIFLGSREFEIKLVESWSEKKKYLQLSVTEIKRGL